MAHLHMLDSVRDTINTSFILQDEAAAIAFDGGFPCEAESLYSYLHGLGADIVAEKTSMRGMLPSDVLNYLPELFSKFE